MSQCDTQKKGFSCVSFLVIDAASTRVLPLQSVPLYHMLALCVMPCRCQVESTTSLSPAAAFLSGENCILTPAAALARTVTLFSSGTACHTHKMLTQRTNTPQCCFMQLLAGGGRGFGRKLHQSTPVACSPCAQPTPDGKRCSDNSRCHCKMRLWFALL